MDRKARQERSRLRASRAGGIVGALEPERSQSRPAQEGAGVARSSRPGGGDARLVLSTRANLRRPRIAQGPGRRQASARPARSGAGGELFQQSRRGRGRPDRGGTSDRLLSGLLPEGNQAAGGAELENRPRQGADDSGIERSRHALLPAPHKQRAALEIETL